jgi:uncharacterized membrane protein
VLQKLKQDLKNDLIAGLLVVIPLATTIWLTITIANWVIRLLTRFPKQLAPFDGLNPLLVDLINLSVGLAVPLAAILLIVLIAARETTDRNHSALPFNPVSSADLSGGLHGNAALG